MATLKILFDQNNQTLQLLQTQDYVNAIESSVLAVRYCRQLVDIDGGTRCLKECLDHSMLLLQDSPASANQHDAHQSNGSSTRFVYQQGIQNPPPTTDLTTVARVLIFNAALALQLLTAEQHQQHQHNQENDNNAQTKNDRATPSSTKILLKAKRLYQLAYRQALDVNENTLFDFAVINNIAVIDQKLGNLVASQSCFCYLQARYLVLMHQRSTERLSQLEGFGGNHPRNTIG